jgi:type I restriction enzyme R subunit
LNQHPEQKARDLIDAQLSLAGWIVQNKSTLNLAAGTGIAVREYPTSTGPADYVLFVGRKPVGIIEAKRQEEGIHATSVEEEAEDYATAKLKHLNNDPLPFCYIATGAIIRFYDRRDPKPRAREIFHFHRPETLLDWYQQNSSLRQRLLQLPQLPTTGLRQCQFAAITNLETSFGQNRKKALIQMATGAGKTFTAITAVYRLLKFANAKRILFLVDTKNLGQQAEQECMAYQPQDDNRRFTELYNVQRLQSSYLATDSQVCISTIQRLYAILKGNELDEEAEQQNPNETNWNQRQAPPITYNPRLPVEFFDFVIIDECHRSIYNLWKQVLDYFDAFLIGLTATPNKHTFGFFDQNVVSQYTHEDAVADNVNVGYDTFIINTQITQQGSRIEKENFVDFRDKLTRAKRWEQLDEDLDYNAKQLDKSVVNPSQIRLILSTFKDSLPQLFPARLEVPKTLIFAKSDSHADDIIQMVRDVFAEGNDFCRKITYNVKNAQGVLSDFRNRFHPRIAVTVDMIATGTDVKPLECLLFMRDVKSSGYFEQMKGRGTRTLTLDELIKVTPSAKFAKDHFVIVDAIGVSRTCKTDSRSLEQKHGVALSSLLEAITVGSRDEALFTSLANRLTRFDKRITPQEREQFVQQTGKTIGEVVHNLLDAFDADTLFALEQQVLRDYPDASPHDIAAHCQQRSEDLQHRAAAVFTGPLNQWILNVQRQHEQVLDQVNTDSLQHAGWDADNKDRARQQTEDFAAWVTDHKDEITALQIFYAQPYQRRQLTYDMITELMQRLRADKPQLAPLAIWQAYAQLETVGGHPRSELTALVALVRRVCGIDTVLTPYDKTVDNHFKNWLFRKQAGPLKFTEEQMQWLRMIKDFIMESFHIQRDDFELLPFNHHGGLGRFYQLFGDEMDTIIHELNQALIA